MLESCCCCFVEPLFPSLLVAQVRVNSMPLITISQRDRTQRQSLNRHSESSKKKNDRNSLRRIMMIGKHHKRLFLHHYRLTHWKSLSL
jgi:hypothetical protein